MRALRFAWLLLAAPAFGDGVEVISPRADSVSVTIYRDLFALVTETREVDLPAGPVTLSFDGVVETLLPASTVLTGTGRELEERNYDYDALTPSSLFSKSVGKVVTLTRTMPGSGVVKQVEATIVAARAGGIVFTTADGTEALQCSGLPEHVTFSEIPGELHAKPRLSVRLGAGPAGKRKVTVSYLAQGFAWKSDYVARLDARGKTLDLRGWVTLRNFTDATLRDAQVQVVAGKLHLLGEEEAGTSVIGDTDEYDDERGLQSARESAIEEMQEDLDSDGSTLQLFSGCFSQPLLPGAFATVESIAANGYGRFMDRGVAMEEVVVTGARSVQAEREQLADYQLYRIPWATDLNARQTKQVMFLQKSSIKVRRFYSAWINAIDYHRDEEDEIHAPRLQLAFENRTSNGLGEPLPEGTLRLYEPGDAGELFAGEGPMRDTAVGEPVEIELAGAIDLSYDLQTDEGSETKGDEDVAELTDASILITNAKGVPVDVEIRQRMWKVQPGTAVVKSNQRSYRKRGDYAWTLRVPANGTRTLTYRVRVPVEPDSGE